MSLYPSLEDLKVDKVIQAQTAFSSNPANPAIFSEASAPIPHDGGLYPKLYPELAQYMGLSLNDEEIHRNLSVVPSHGQHLATRPSSTNYMVAPITGNDLGIRRAEIKQGVREVILCKDQDGKIGLRLKSVDNTIITSIFCVYRNAILFTEVFQENKFLLKAMRCEVQQNRIICKSETMQLYTPSLCKDT